MDEKDWELLSVLHEERSITKAAKRLYFTQPTVSAKIKQIEKELDCELIIRTARGINFTPQGELMCRFSNRYLEEYRQTKNALQQEGHDLTGTLCLGSASVYAKYKLTDVLCQFTQRYPHVSIELSTGISQHIYDLLSSGRIQAGIIRGDYPWSGKKSRLRQDPYCVINATPLDVKILPDYPMIFRQADRPLQSALNDWWARSYDRPPYVRMEVDSLSICMQMVAKGYGYTLLSGTGTFEGLWNQDLYNPDGTPLMRDTWLYLNDKCDENNIVKAFYDFITAYEQQ